MNVRHLMASLVFAASSSTALGDGVTAIGRADTKTDWSGYTWAQASGEIGVALNRTGLVPAYSRPPTIDPYNMNVGIFTTKGKGVSKAKSKTVVTTDAFSGTGTAGGTTLTGAGDWTYSPGVLAFGRDKGVYNASTSITPAPGAAIGDFQAWANSSDPIEFSSLTSTSSLYSYTLESTTLTAPTPQSYAGLSASASLNGNTIFSFSVVAPGGMTSNSDLDIHYSSMRGSAFDSAMETSIRNAFGVDSGTGTATLSSFFDIFPELSLPVSAGTNVYTDSLTTLAGSTPSPSAAVVLGLAGLRACRRRR